MHDLTSSLVSQGTRLYGAALAGFEEVASAKPKEEKALYGAALSAYRLGDAQRALRWAQRCVKVNGRHHKAYLLLGNLAVEREDFEKAEAYFEDARSLNPDDGRSLAALGRLKIRNEPARGRHLLREALWCLSLTLQHILIWPNIMNDADS